MSTSNAEPVLPGPEHTSDETDFLQVKPLAVVCGESVHEMPRDLFIPPDALEIMLEKFEGPLDLLLYLIRKQDFDILDVPLAVLTEQYMAYVHLMKAIKLELAGEYLVMAALLGEIKSRSLLPRAPEVVSDEEDPRAVLIRRLQEYEVIKDAAEKLDQLPRCQRDIFPVMLPALIETNTQPPEVSLNSILSALKDVLKRAQLLESHHVQRESLSVRERMGNILLLLENAEFVRFERFFSVTEGRLGVVVTLLAILELVKDTLIDLVQAEPLSPIHVRRLGAVSQAVSAHEPGVQDSQTQINI